MASSTHWADVYADRIIREKGDKPQYVCASGITPSGTVHIGNFREIISVDLVVRALRDKGKSVRFIYSWDDFDVFRKVPSNVPDGPDLQPYLRRPITHVPDPYGSGESFARANEIPVENDLKKLGIEPEYIYQAKNYEASKYADGIRRALERSSTIREVLNEHRSEPLSDAWLPVRVFCSSCDKDTTVVEQWDGDWALTYRCDSCGNREDLDLRKAPTVKLPWRADWPMRWKLEQVDFEPAGKEHHSAGGSFDTAKRIIRDVYDGDPPVTFKYDFISIKGVGGKISSSKGNVVGLDEMLAVYQPEVVRFLFAGTRPDTEFAVSFDLDVIKIYEDYDRCERVYYGIDEVGEKKRDKQRRIYELSQIDGVPSAPPEQIPFRHLCNLLQIAGGDVSEALAQSGIDTTAGDEDARIRMETRARCAWTWITTYAPEDFRFALRTPDDGWVDLEEPEKRAVGMLYEKLASGFDEYDEKTLGELFYDIAGEVGIDTKAFFSAMYRVLVGKERGPRLANFILTAGAERIVPVLRLYSGK